MKRRHLVKAGFLVAALALLVSGPFYAQAFAVEGRTPQGQASPAHPIELAGDTMAILPVWEQAKVMNRLLAEKQEVVLPQVMRETGGR